MTAIVPPVCPTVEPETAEPCAVEGLLCTYGSSLAAYCRRHYQCTELTWQLPEVRNAHCVTQPAGFCPEEPQPGADCTQGEISYFVPCEYAQGVGCYCEGAEVHSPGTPGSWVCLGPPRNGACPERLPNLGDGCAIPTGDFCPCAATCMGAGQESCLESWVPYGQCLATCASVCT